MRQIHNYYAIEKDISLSENNHSKPSDNLDYTDSIVKKPWGYEYLALDNGEVAIWILHIARKRKTSLHCHVKKHTGLILLSGEVICKSLSQEKKLNPLDCVNINKQCFHSTESVGVQKSDIYPFSENGAWVMEIETPVDKGDLVRINDSYGRKGKKYEGLKDIVSHQGERLKFEVPNENNTEFHTKKLGCAFTIQKGKYEPQGDAIACIISIENQDKKPSLDLAKLYTEENLIETIKNQDIQNYTFLTIQREKDTMKVSDYVIHFVEKLGIQNIFSISGGGAMHLVDSAHQMYVAMHHEQAAAMAAESYSRINGIGCALFTTGPGGTNALTGVAGAWIDSIPVIYLSGQVGTNHLSQNTKLRQFGVQEIDITTLVKSITKYAVTITDVRDIRYEMEKAAHIALEGRPGPVWVDIPLNIQSQVIDIQSLRCFEPDHNTNQSVQKKLKRQVNHTIEILNQSERPVLVCGYGIRLAKAETSFLQLLKKLEIPIISSWTSSDLIDSNLENYIGRAGIFGDRASNFAIQNADCILSIGSRLSIPQIGYNADTFAREAKIIMVDIDSEELNKPSLHVELGIQADAKEFIEELNTQLNQNGLLIKNHWLSQCKKWKEKYPVVLPEYENQSDKINSFYFVKLLSDFLNEEAVVVTDMGTSFTCTMQTFQVKHGQRLTTSSGHASMGFGVPGAIGACYAHEQQQTICISGDGSLQMNIQELQTIAHNQLPIILFVINNQGYLTIKHMQENHFGRYVGAEKSSGVSAPDMMKVAYAYNIPAERLENHTQLKERLPKVLEQTGPYICEIMMSEDQPLIPRVSSLKKPDGSIVAKPLEDLYPFLERDEFLENMIVPTMEILEEYKNHEDSKN